MAKLVVAPEFWISRMLPEGTVEQWLVADGATVAEGDLVAELRIEGELVKLKAPTGGCSSSIARPTASSSQDRL